MNSALRSKKLLRLVGLTSTGLILAVGLAIFGCGAVWNQYDLKVLDLFYRRAVEHGLGPRQSPQVVITAISDKSYDFFAKNTLDRSHVARLNQALAQLNTGALAYDLIFARPSDPESDAKLTASLRTIGSVCLPIGLATSETAAAFRWEEGRAYDRFRSDYLRKPLEKGLGRPYYATRALMQADDFAAAAGSSGHISSFSDPDGVYRHVIMLLNVDGAYFPTLSLSMFLNYARVSFEHLIVEWGRRIIIPATREGLLQADVIIPIDDRGRAFIPFPQVWDQSFKKMESVALLQYMGDENLRGNLTEFFEGNLVLIGDISVGSSDLGQTPLESHAPLLLIHASMLNAMLTNCFYQKWSPAEAMRLIGILGVVLGLSAMLRSSWFLYGTGSAVGLALVGLTWVQFIQFRLLPIVTVGGSVLIIFFGLVATLELVVGKERSFIRNAFARYVPVEVVDTLLANPEMLKLGGEERVLTVLFSDLADFTRISEMISPSQLVALLNEYLTEMTDIVLAHGGIIDKFEGDAIMAEFGAPLPRPDHADMAVKAGLRMQKRLKELREVWGSRGLPALSCRVGINTGPMIVGNMGSNQVFDYTVLGDSVNLASRLEGANKRYNTTLMISEFTHQSLTPGLFRARVLDVIKVKGKSKSVKVFEVYGETSEPIDDEEKRYHSNYQEAFELYLARDFGSARKKFQAALSIRAQDRASTEMLERLDRLKANELPPDWDGSITLTTK
jgi:adenylate cyclase